MRIAYVLKKFPRLSETFILNELLGLEELGHEVTVFSLRPADDEPRHADLQSLRAEVIQVPRDRVTEPCEDEAARAIWEQLPEERRRRTWSQGVHLARLCRERGIEHLHAHFMTIAAHVAAFARTQGGPPFTVTAHAKDVFRSGVNATLFRRLSRMAKRVITVSEFNLRYIEERYFAGQGAPVSVVYNGIPLDRFGAEEGERDPELVLGVGRLVEKKGFDLLLRATRRLADQGRDFRVLLVGNGEDREALETLCDDLGLQERVHFTGGLPRDEVIACMRKARLFVLPCREGSDGNRDALPTVLIEALASSLPVVSTEMVGIPEIVPHESCGLLVPPDDAEALAEAIDRMLGDEELWERCRAAAAPRAERYFDRRRTLPELLRIFQGEGAPHPAGSATRESESA